MNTSGTISPPVKLKSIPETAQWLGGQGIGGWFYIVEVPNNNSHFRIIRYSPEGLIECDRVFTLVASSKFDINKAFSFTYISHCAECNILQNGTNYRFIFKN